MSLDTEKVINFLKIAGGLKYIERFKGQFYWREYKQQERYESVADHCWRMSLFLLTIEKSLSKPIDLSKALKMVLLHDLGEIIVGDLSPLGSDGTGRDSHVQNKEAAQKKFEDEKAAVKKILAELPPEQADEFFDIWMEYEEQDTFEAKVVKAIDKLEGKLQAAEYLKGHMYEKHLDFSLNHGVNTLSVDPILEELGQTINNELKKDFKEFQA